MPTIAVSTDSAPADVRPDALDNVRAMLKQQHRTRSITRDADSLVVLAAYNFPTSGTPRILAKEFAWEDEEWRERGARAQYKFFDGYEVSFADFDEANVLLSTLVTSPEFRTTAIAPGVLDASLAKGAARFRRLKHDRDNAKAAFADAPRRLLFLDVDKWQLQEKFKSRHVAPAQWIPRQLEGIVSDLATSVMPDEFRTASVMAYASGSCGLKSADVLSLRLIYWLDEPLTLAAQKRLVMRLNSQTRGKIALVDPSKSNFDQTIYSPERLIFTAAPALHGAPDPFVERFVVIDGKRDALRLSPDWTRIIDLSERRVSMKRKRERASQTPREFEPDIVGDTALRAVINAATIAYEPGNTDRAVFTGLVEVLRVCPIERRPDVIESFRRQLLSRLSEISRWPTERTKRHERAARLEPGEFQRVAENALRFLEAEAFDEIELEVKPAQANVHGQVPVDEASAALDGALDEFISDLGKEKFKHILRPCTVIRGAAGLGKSRRVISRLVSEPALLRTYQVFYLVPTNELAEELCKFAKEQSGVDTLNLIRHHRGRERLCINEEHGRLCKEYEAASLSPMEYVCQPSGRDGCPQAADCPWLSQKQDKAPGLIFMPHAYLGATFERKAYKVNDSLIFVIDESVTGQVFRQRSLSSNDVVQLERRPKFAFGLGPAHFNHRHQTAELLKDLLETGRLLTSTAFISERNRRRDSSFLGFTGDPIKIEREIRNQLFRTLETVLAAKAKATDQRASSIFQLQREIGISRAISAFWKQVRASQAAFAREHVFGVRRLATSGEAKVEIVQLRMLPKVVRGHSLLVLDATASSELLTKVTYDALDPLQNVWSRPPKIVSIEPERRDYNLVQAIDRPFGKSSLLASGQGSRTHSDSLLSRLHLFIWREAASANIANVVAQKEVVERLRLLGLPGNVRTGHFNALRGLDTLKDADLHIQIGRPTIGMELAELHAEALYADDELVSELGEVLPDEFSTTEKEVRLVDGETHLFVGEGHPDPRVQTVLSQIADAEAEQALGRLRLVHTKRKTPVRIFVFGQVALETPVHKVTSSRQLLRINQSDSLAAQKVVFRSASSMARAYPALVPDAESNRRTLAKASWEIARADQGERRIGKFRRGNGLLMKRLSKAQLVLLPKDTADPAHLIATTLQAKPDQVDWLGWHAG